MTFCARAHRYRRALATTVASALFVVAACGGGDAPASGGSLEDVGANFLTSSLELAQKEAPFRIVLPAALPPGIGGPPVITGQRRQRVQRELGGVATITLAFGRVLEGTADPASRWLAVRETNASVTPPSGEFTFDGYEAVDVNGARVWVAEGRAGAGRFVFFGASRAKRPPSFSTGDDPVVTDAWWQRDGVTFALTASGFGRDAALAVVRSMLR